MTIRTYVWRQSAGGFRPVYPMYVWITDQWRTVQNAYVWQNGAWRQVFEPTIITTTNFTAPTTPDDSGDTVTFAGSVTTGYGPPSDGGTVTVEGKFTTDAEYTPLYTGIAVSQSDGSWSRSHTYVDVGLHNYRAKYVPTGSGPETASTSPVRNVDVELRDMGLLYSVAQSHTSCRFNWSAIPNAAEYEVYNGAAYVKTVTSPDSGTISVSQNTTYSWRVRARRQDPDGTWVSSTWSPYLYFNGGRPEIRDIGSQSNIQTTCVDSSQWRSCCGWDERDPDNVLQGYFSGYGGYGDYRGTAYYGSNGVKNRIIAVVGSARYNGGWCTNAWTYLYRVSGVGSSGANTLYFYSTTSNCTGGAPDRQAGPWSTTGLAWGAAAWVNCGSGLGARLASGAENGWTWYNNSSANYGEYNGYTHGSDCDFLVNWSWNYVTQSYIAPSWWR